MTTQRLHAAMAPIDVLTRIEHEEVMHKSMDMLIRDRVRGIDSARLPPVAITSLAGGTLNLYAGGSSDGSAGPEQGDVWMLRTANVASSAFATDVAKYVLFRGSSPSDPGTYTNRQLLNGFAMSAGIGTVSQPAVPASTVAQQNVNAVPVQVVIGANGATITAVVVNGITVGAAAGTYTVPAYGSISITYSVATPTWVWSSLQTPQLGFNVGVEYDAPTKGRLFHPGEQLYAQVFNAVAGNTYLLTGEFIRCPAEMKGKILG
jgi:hypothetical protein